MAKTKKVVKDVVSIRKSNDLVEARYRFDIWETRIFTKMLSMINHSDEDFFEYKIFINELIQDFNLATDKNAYSMVKQGAEKLMRKIIKVIMKDEGNWVEFQTPIIGAIKSTIDDNEGSYIKIGFHPDMKPYLLELKEKYLVYDFKNVSNLRSPYYIRIYELLKQYEKIGWRRFEVQTLKEILGITEEYKLYGHFKEKILNKTQENLATYTDISYTYEEIKQGRGVHSILFKIFQNKPQKQKKTNSKKAKPDPLTKEENTPVSLDLFSAPLLEATTVNTELDLVSVQKQQLLAAFLVEVEGWSVRLEVLSLLLETQSEEAIRKGIAYTKMMIAQGKVSENPGGFFLKAVKEGYTNSGFERKLQQQKKAAQREQLAALKIAVQEELVALRKEYDAARNQIIRHITATDETITPKAIELLQKELKGYFKLKQLNPSELSVEDYRQDPVLRVFVIEKIELLNSAAFEKIMPTKDRIAMLEEQLKRM
jgi:plasmid replication initiation protein